MEKIPIIPGIGNPEGDLEHEAAPEVLVRLHFNRHFEKGQLPEGATDDRRIPLSAQGKLNAKESASHEVDLSRSRAIGSPRERAPHTAALLMAGKYPEIDATEDLDELERKVREISGTMALVRIDERLDFIDDPEAPLGRMLNDAYARKQYFKAILHESDQIARAQGSEYESTYSHKAARFAELILHYLDATARLSTTKKWSDRKKFERFLGTHQGLSESFLAKLVEVTQGVDAREAFAREIGDEGFDYGEGFDVEIGQRGDEQVASVIYTNRCDGKTSRIPIDSGILRTIIGEANDMRSGRS